MLKSRRPSTDPWGTRCINSAQLLKHLFIFVFCHLLDRSSFISLTESLLKPYAWCLAIRSLWFKVSKVSTSPSIRHPQNLYRLKSFSMFLWEKPEPVGCWKLFHTHKNTEINDLLYNYLFLNQTSIVQFNLYNKYHIPKYSSEIFIE